MGDIKIGQKVRFQRPVKSGDSCTQQVFDGTTLRKLAKQRRYQVEDSNGKRFRVSERNIREHTTDL